MFMCLTLLCLCVCLTLCVSLFLYVCASLCVDNGEFACGDVLGSCLDKVQGFNVLVCVSQQVQGMFVTDMMQPQKLRAVKEAAAQVF
jgi:hypothetical protein